jgi:hypothetical protein
MTEAVNTNGKGGIFLTNLGGNTRLVSLKCAHPICSETYKFTCNLFSGQVTFMYQSQHDSLNEVISSVWL